MSQVFLLPLRPTGGTRFLAFCMALTGALAFINWRVVYGGILATVMAIAVAILGGEYNLVYAVMFPVTALLIYSFIQWPREGKKPVWHLVFFSLCLLWLLAGSILGSSETFSVIPYIATNNNKKRSSTP